MIDGAARLLAETAVGRIRLHDMVAGLLDARFQSPGSGSESSWRATRA